MAGVEVDLTDETDEGYAFRVVVVDAGREARHHVTLSSADFERLAAEGEEPEVFVERCFEFLLAREPASSILETFDVSVIGRYFPEFEEEISK